MILRSVSLRGWRCYVDPVEIGPMSEGLNVIHAPNARGKSTIFEAMLRGLFDGHRVKGQQVDEIKPWGRELAPEVTVEFHSGGADYRVVKRFIDHPASELYRKEGAGFTMLAEGDAANDRVRELLLGKAPGRGLSNLVHQGICQVLWAPQGRMGLDSISEDMVANIYRSLGAQVGGGHEVGALEAKVNALHDTYFTSRGSPRKGQGSPDLPGLEARAAELSRQVEEAAASAAAFEDASRGVEDLRATRDQASMTARTTAEELKGAQKAASEYAGLLSKRNEQEQKVITAEARHKELTQRIDSIAATRKERDAAEKRIAELEDVLPAHSRERDERKARVAELRHALDLARKDRQKVDRAQQDAQEARRYVGELEKLNKLRDTLAKVGEAGKALEEVTRERSELVAPDSTLLRKLRRAVKEKDEARVLLDASLITLEITPAQDSRMSVIAGEDPGELPLKKGVPQQAKGAPEVAIDIEGLAHVRAWGPESDVVTLREKISSRERSIEEMTREFGTADIRKLENLQETAKDLEKRIGEASTALETLLAGETPEEIEQQAAKAAALVKELEAAHAGWEESLPDCDALDAAALEMRNSFVSRVEETEAAMDTAQAALMAVEGRRAAVASELEKLSERLDDIRKKLEEQQADGLDDETRRGRLEEIALEWDAARAALAEADRALEAYPGDPVKEVEMLERTLEAAEKRAEEALAGQKAEEGRLQQLASEGGYSKLAALEEERNSLEERLARETTRARAIKLLHDTVLDCREEALSAVALPVEEAATRFMRRIAGARFGDLQLSDGFTPSAVDPKLEGAVDVGIGNLSGGEQEQVHFAVRLALAQVLAGEERQLVVLDDALTATDSPRFARILTILEELVSTLQILVLTCHPEKYGALTGARFIDLQELTSR